MYAPAFVALAPFTVTVTSTVPTACAGTVTMSVVAVTFVTVAVALPNNTLAPPAKPVPVIVTCDPPVAAPLVALRLVTTGT